MSSSNSRIERLFQVLHSDLLDTVVALFVLGALLLASFDYEGPVGQFPRVFLVAAFVLMAINLLILAIPDPYGNSLEVFTQGVADMMEGDETDDVAADSEPSPIEKLALGLGMITILAGYFGLAYLVGFVYPIPVVALVILYVYGDGGLLQWVMVSAILVVLVYYLFGDVMNVPVMDGELLP